MKESKNTETPPKSGGAKKIIIQLIIVLVVIAAGLFFWFGQKEELVEAAEQIKPPVRVIQPEKTTLQQDLGFTGYVESETMVYVMPQIGGVLEQVLVEAGDTVVKDQRLARIDDEPYKLQLQQAEAAFTAYESTWQRVSNLYKAGSATQQNYDETRAQYNSGKSQYELAKLQYGYTWIEAPIEGTVLMKNATAGALVSPNSQQPLFVISDLDNLVVKSRIPESYYRFFSRKEAIQAFAEIPSLKTESIPLDVVSVAPYVQAETKNFEVKCRIPSSENQVRPGMFVSIRFILKERVEVWALPLKAMINDGECWYVDGDGQARYKQLDNYFTDGRLVEVPSDWEGLDFILEGQHFLQEGQLVNIINRSGDYDS